MRILESKIDVVGYFYYLASLSVTGLFGNISIRILAIRCH